MSTNNPNPDPNSNGNGGQNNAPASPPKKTPEPKLRRIPDPVIAHERACHNLAWRAPLLHKDGITTQLIPDTNSVRVSCGDRSVLMTTGPYGWVPSPFYAELVLPLDSHNRLAVRLHHLLTR